MVLVAPVVSDPSTDGDEPIGLAGYYRFQSVDPTKNRFRFYTIEVQPCLFGGWGLILTWGRLGGNGRQLRSFYDSQLEVAPLLRRLIQRRLKRGYVLVTCT